MTNGMLKNDSCTTPCFVNLVLIRTLGYSGI